MEKRIQITPLMRKINQVLLRDFPGVNNCISLLRRNTVVEVPRDFCDAVVTSLKRHFSDVVNIKKAYLMIEDLHDFILVKPLVSESPVVVEEGINLPSLEKLLVDRLSDKEYLFESEDSLRNAYQDAFDYHEINEPRLLRYAARKGKRPEVARQVDSVDRDRMKTIKSIREYLPSIPIEKAWLFGSFSRKEERKDSDLDILVQLSPSAKLGLLAFSDIQSHMELLTGRKVDLVVDKAIKPFAKASIDRDKILIYERSRT